VGVVEERFESLLVSVGRTKKPRKSGLTIVLDKGLGPGDAEQLCAAAGRWFDYAKLAWGSSMITGQLSSKLERYRAAGVEPLLGGTLFEYAFIHGKTEELLALCRDLELHVEISDGVASVPRADKLRWIERFAAHGHVFSEVGGKTYRVGGDWAQMIAEERRAGAAKVVIEGREIGPPGQSIRTDLIDLLVSVAPVEDLIWEALERAQQVWLIKRFGPNVNLGNILPADVMTLESFRQGLKEHTLLEMAQSSKG
jgi:phosphosulfolactate synthase